jgi:hypothetical protein
VCVCSCVRVRVCPCACACVAACRVLYVIEFWGLLLYERVLLNGSSLRPFVCIVFVVVLFCVCRDLACMPFRCASDIEAYARARARARESALVRAREREGGREGGRDDMPCSRTEGHACLFSLAPPPLPLSLPPSLPPSLALTSRPSALWLRSRSLIQGWTIPSYQLIDSAKTIMEQQGGSTSAITYKDFIRTIIKLFISRGESSVA